MAVAQALGDEDGWENSSWEGLLVELIGTVTEDDTDER